MQRGGVAYQVENKGSDKKRKGYEKRYGPHLPLVSSCFFVFFVAILRCLGQQPAGSRLVLLDSSTVPFQSLEIAGGKLLGEGVPADLTLDDLRRIEMSEPQVAAAAKPVIVADLRGGGRVLAK